VFITHISEVSYFEVSFGLSNVESNRYDFLKQISYNIFMKLNSDGLTDNTRHRQHSRKISNVFRDARIARF